jgi:hypothetical protein
MISQCVSYLCNLFLIGVIRDFRTFSEISLKWIDKIGRDGCGFERMKEEVNPVRKPFRGKSAESPAL